MFNGKNDTILSFSQYIEFTQLFFNWSNLVFWNWGQYIWKHLQAWHRTQSDRVLVIIMWAFLFRSECHFYPFYLLVLSIYYWYLVQNARVNKMINQLYDSTGWRGSKYLECHKSDRILAPVTEFWVQEVQNLILYYSMWF